MVRLLLDRGAQIETRTKVGARGSVARPGEGFYLPESNPGWWVSVMSWWWACSLPELHTARARGAAGDNNKTVMEPSWS